MRLKFKNSKQKELICNFKNRNNFTWKEFANFIDVKPGALKGWYYERNLIPKEIYLKIDSKRKFKKEIIEELNDNWGKIKGAKKSQGSLKIIKEPRKSEELAELIGIILGDGNIHRFIKGRKVRSYMVWIAGDKRYDYDYLTKYVKKLIEDLFNIKAKIEERKSNEILIIVHSKQVVDYLIKLGLKAGDKIRNNISIPKWIFKNKKYLKACIRGLIDTDGCIYTLKPNYPNLYQLSFKNYNYKLLEDTRKAFIELGYPISRISSNIQIYLSQQKYIRKFYKEIGFSNDKHLKRYTAPWCRGQILFE